MFSWVSQKEASGFGMIHFIYFLLVLSVVWAFVPEVIICHCLKVSPPHFLLVISVSQVLKNQAFDPISVDFCIG